jgi:hypothetical protein
VVLIATPVDLRRVMSIERPVCRARYEYADHGTPTLADIVRQWVAELPGRENRAADAPLGAAGKPPHGAVT